MSKRRGPCASGVPVRSVHHCPSQARDYTFPIAALCKGQGKAVESDADTICPSNSQGPVRWERRPRACEGVFVTGFTTRERLAENIYERMTMGKLLPQEFQVLVEAVDAIRRVEKQLAHVVAEVERVSEEIFVIGGRLIDSDLNYNGRHDVES